MFSTNRIFLYKVIAIACTVILCFVQLLHIRNIYKLENQVFAADEKKILKMAYAESIVNDKLYPGAVKTIDNILYRNFSALEGELSKQENNFEKLSDKICDTLFTTLRARNNTDSLLAQIKKRNNINSDIIYALFVEDISIAKEPNKYYAVFDRNADRSNTDELVTPGIGAKIGGSLKTYNALTLTSSINVSEETAPSYKMSFALYCDHTDRVLKIIYKTLPQTLLSVFSILAVLTIFFLTFSNWIKQKKLSEMKTDFINTITHEFQTPLTAIIIANKTMDQENSYLQNPKLTALNTILNRQTERLSVLIKQITETSGEKPIHLILHEHSIKELMEDIVEDYQLNITDTNTVVEFEHRATKDRIVLDKLHFTSIILNIISNGIKYNSKDQKQIIMDTKDDEHGNLILTIKDNGDGMSKRVKRKMFSRFYRKPSLVSSNEPGIGLGLYYTKQCLDAHGWQFEVQSKEKVGTAFIICIPSHR